MAEGAEFTRYGWGELYKVTTVDEVETETLIARGDAEYTREVTTENRTAPYGTSIRPSRMVAKETKEELTIETDEVINPILCINYGLAIGSDMTAAIAPGDGILHETGLRFKFIDVDAPTAPVEIRDGFDAYLSIDGSVSMKKGEYSKVKVKAAFGAVPGTVKIAQRSA